MLATRSTGVTLQVRSIERAAGISNWCTRAASPQKLRHSATPGGVDRLHRTGAAALDAHPQRAAGPLGDGDRERAAEVVGLEGQGLVHGERPSLHPVGRGAPACDRGRMVGVGPARRPPAVADGNNT